MLQRKIISPKHRIFRARDPEIAAVLDALGTAQERRNSARPLLSLFLPECAASAQDKE